MRLSIVALKLYKKSFAQLAALTQTVIDGFTAQVLLYPLPNPTILQATTDLATLTASIAAWGTVGNRGSHNDHLALLAARNVVRQNLFQLGVYTENTTPGDRTSLALIGWDLRQIPRHRVGKLEAVQNLRQFISRRVDTGTLRLKWEKPLNAVNVHVSGYQVRRGATSVFDQSVVIDIVTDTTVTDLNPGAGYQYYWVIAFNASGFGVKADPVMAIATPNP